MFHHFRRAGGGFTVDYRRPHGRLYMRTLDHETQRDEIWSSGYGAPSGELSSMATFRSHERGQIGSHVAWRRRRVIIIGKLLAFTTQDDDPDKGGKHEKHEQHELGRSLLHAWPLKSHTVRFVQS
nr:hypothetical protein CFP56_65868 [Quercus suber]